MDVELNSQQPIIGKPQLDLTRCVHLQGYLQQLYIHKQCRREIFLSNALIHPRDNRCRSFLYWLRKRTMNSGKKNS